MLLRLGQRKRKRNRNRNRDKIRIGCSLATFISLHFSFVGIGVGGQDFFHTLELTFFSSSSSCSSQEQGAVGGKWTKYQNTNESNQIISPHIMHHYPSIHPSIPTSEIQLQPLTSTYSNINRHPDPIPKYTTKPRQPNTQPTIPPKTRPQIQPK